MKKIETLIEYQELANRTCVDLTDNGEDMFHMNSGIVTEVGEAIDPIKKFIAYGKEIDIANVNEELGDAAWYIANRAYMFLNRQDSKRLWGTNDEFDKACTEMQVNFQANLDIIGEDKKKRMIFAAELINSIKPTILIDFSSPVDGIGQLVLIKQACDLLELDFWQMLTTNIEKLQARYPEKFTQEAAVNRNLDAEREILEKGVEQTEGDN